MGRRPSDSTKLSLDVIVAEAISMIDEDGLAAFTMRQLATRLDVYPTALYWHAGSKARLVSLASATIFEPLTSDIDRTIPWQDQLRALAGRVRSAMHAHPNLVPLVAAEMPVSILGALDYIEGLLAILRQAGFEGTELVHAYNNFNGGVLGWVVIELSDVPDSANADSSWPAGFRDELENLGPLKYPNISSVLPKLADRAFMVRWHSGREKPLDESFAAFVDTLLLGFDRIRARD